MKKKFILLTVLFSDIYACNSLNKYFMHYIAAYFGWATGSSNHTMPYPHITNIAQENNPIIEAEPQAFEKKDICEEKASPPQLPIIRPDIFNCTFETDYIGRKHIEIVGSEKFLKNAQDCLERKYDLPKSSLCIFAPKSNSYFDVSPIIARYKTEKNEIIIFGKNSTSLHDSEILKSIIRKEKPHAFLYERAFLQEFLASARDPQSDQLSQTPFQSDGSVHIADPSVIDQLEDMRLLGVTLHDVLVHTQIERMKTNKTTLHKELVENGTHANYVLDGKKFELPKSHPLARFLKGWEDEHINYYNFNIESILYLTRNAYALNKLKTMAQHYTKIVIATNPSHFFIQRNVLKQWFGEPTIMCYGPSLKGFVINPFKDNEAFYDYCLQDEAHEKLLRDGKRALHNNSSNLPAAHTNFKLKNWKWIPKPPALQKAYESQVELSALAETPGSKTSSGKSSTLRN